MPWVPGVGVLERHSSWRLWLWDQREIEPGPAALVAEDLHYRGPMDGGSMIKPELLLSVASLFLSFVVGMLSAWHAHKSISRQELRDIEERLAHCKDECASLAQRNLDLMERLVGHITQPTARREWHM